MRAGWAQVATPAPTIPQPIDGRKRGQHYKDLALPQSRGFHMTPADALYTIVRQLCDPTYAGPEPPTTQDMFDAVAAYEVQQKMSGAAGNVPQPERLHCPTCKALLLT